jgi:hypothetical protein
VKNLRMMTKYGGDLYAPYSISVGTLSCHSPGPS